MVNCRNKQLDIILIHFLIYKVCAVVEVTSLGKAKEIHPYIVGRYNLYWGYLSANNRIMYAHENPEPLLMLKSIPLRENEEAEWVVRIVNVFYVLEKVSLYNENTFYSIIWISCKIFNLFKDCKPCK